MEKFLIRKIHSYLNKISFVKILKPLEKDGLDIKGKVSISLSDLKKSLEFDIAIGLQYPFRSHDTESIKFINTDLLEYNHVMGDGTICIHTSHNINLEEKLKIDFLSLKNWIIRYYINKNNDSHYEHLIVPDLTINNDYYTFLFTEIDYEFKKGDYGLVKLSQINDGKSKEKTVFNYITQAFANQYGDEVAFCKWSKGYKNYTSNTQGIFVFIEAPPAIHNRFILQNWKQFSEIFSQNFLDFLHQNEKIHINKKQKEKLLPFFIGYKISNSEIHWQVSMIEIGNFPIVGSRDGKKWNSVLSDGIINWAKTRNSSYQYFFGRGTFCEELTNKKVLIIGVGAVGSNIARTLVKGGIKEIDLADYDIKEPENICRAEFNFFNGITDKVLELGQELSLISPFVEVGQINQSYFEYISKVLYKEEEAKKQFENFLNSYDLIFDCSTDNDLMYVLDSLNLKNDLINLSITNHAKDLVCSFHPNSYSFVITQFTKILDNDIEDLYNPTGCWSPTFKASYNDIAVLVQYALKQINLIYGNKLPKNNFVLETNTSNGYEIKLQEY